MASRPANKLMGPPTQQKTPLAIIDNSVYKNRVQELTKKLGLPPPICLTINEGSSYAPKFRTIVLVDGVQYISQHSCSKSAEQEALRIAYDSISGKDNAEGQPLCNLTGKKRLEEAKSPMARKFQAMAASSQPPNNCVRNSIEKEAPSHAITECTGSDFVANVEGCPSLYQNPIFCKSILYEYSVKKKMNIPKYQTKCKSGFPPRFLSIVDINGEEYLGEEAASKKEAEQLAAQAAIKSLIDSRTLVLIIKSKEIIFDLTPAPKPLLYIEHEQPLPSATGQVPTKAVVQPSTGRASLPPMVDQGTRGPTFVQKPEIKQGENPEEANTMSATATFTNLGPGNYNARAKRRAESINSAQRKRK